MAGFCTKCGASVPSATGFCPTCGAPIGSPLATPASQPSAAAAAPPVAPPPTAAAGAYAPPPKSGGGALKIILIVVAVVVGLGVIGAGIVGYGIYKVAHSVQTDSKGNTTVSALGSTFSAGKNVDVSAADLGVPLYPGATAGEGGMHMTLPTGSVVTAVYVTSDPASSVVAFYKGKLGANESDIDTANGSVLTSGSQGANGKSGIEITVGPGTGNNSGKTQFVVVHTVSTQ